MNENYPLPLHLTPIPNLHFNQGIYRELKRVIPPEAWLQQEGDPFDDLGSSKELQFGCQGTLRSSMSPLCPVGSSRKPTTWLVIGYKSLEKTLDSSLEATWKEWTGARHVYLHLRSDFEIRRISFFHRAYPIDNLDLFMYVVVMEIGNVDDRNRIWLLDFVQRMRAERMKGFVTVYSEIDEEVSCIENEYLKYKNATSPTGIHPPLRTHFHQTPPPPKTAPASLGHDTNPLTLSQHLLESQSAEINGNIKFMENLLAEIRKAQIGEYF